MSNLSNVLPAKAKGSTSEAKSVQNSSTTMAAKSLPAGEQATRDENAPSTSQGRQHQSSHHSSHHSSQQRQVSAASCSNSHSHSHSHSHSYSHSRSNSNINININTNDISSSNSNSNSNSNNNSNSNSNTNRIGSAMPMTQLNGPVMRIKRELNEIVQNPPPNCSAEMCKDDLFHWKAIIIGPSGTAYEGGIFKLDIRFPGAYPFRPPQIRFITRIYHCNVDSRGVICLDVLNERWSPVMNIAKVLLSIWVLIGECNPNDPLVMGIADQYKCNRKEHDKVARYWTKRFAMPKSKSSSKFEQEVMLSNGQERDKDQEQELEQVSEQISGLELVGASDLTAEQVLETQNQNHNQDQEEETAASSGASSVNVSADRSRNQL